MHCIPPDTLPRDSSRNQLPPRNQDRYVAVDVETASVDISSICQIAVVEFVSGSVGKVWHSLINPRTPFAAFNINLHGIDASTVRDAPDFSAVVNTLSALLSGRVVVSHMPFDRISLERAYLGQGMPVVDCRWLDTAQVARRAWPRFAKRGYGLKSVASWCGIDFQHHNAVEDANTAGRILAMAVEQTGITSEEWLNRCPAPNARSFRKRGHSLTARQVSSSNLCETE